MLGLKDGIGRLEIKGKGINLTVTSSQAQFASAIKHAPFLKKSGRVIELNEAQLKKRDNYINAKLVKNGNKKDNTKK